MEYIPKEAIEKAVEGGWKYSASAGWHSALGHEEVQCMYLIALDPSFWQALGKALEWGIHAAYVTDPDDGAMGIEQVKEWKLNAFRFYDLILTEQSTEAFWRELLPANPNGRTAPNQSQ